MILDYSYNNEKRSLSISYIGNDKNKKMLTFNVNKFKSFYRTPTGKYENWDGAKCDIKMVSKPSQFDLKTFILELPQQYKMLLKGKTNPSLYTFDIEVKLGDNDEFPDPSQAKFPISTISVTNDRCDVIVMGTVKMDDSNIDKIYDRFVSYMNSSHFFKQTGLKMPSFKYIYFESEEKMIRFFLEKIVAQVPVLAGWNSILFDWQYIVNRVRGYFPNIPLSSSSMTGEMYYKSYTDMKNDRVTLPMPCHTLILDMMDVVCNFDMTVMPIKESTSLSYISRESIKMDKIQYDGDLKELYENDYPTYVFYNAIDSILVNLIDRKFKTMQNIYAQALFCVEKIGSCFSKIALTEALLFNYFFDNGKKVVPDDRSDVERGVLVGAYVREPSPGLYRYVCCNDFASLYPSTIITCNISFENFMGTGDQFTAEEIEAFKKDKNYFVSVNNCVYKNDKDYAFKAIEKSLKANRDTGKYLAKKMEATLISDIDHIMNNVSIKSRRYDDDVIANLNELGYAIETSDDIRSFGSSLWAELRESVSTEITYLTSFEQAMKTLGNSMYGGSSHVACFWYNMAVANDITGEARNLIHIMEKHIPEYLKANWGKLTDLHDKLNIKVDPIRLSKILKGNKELATIIYGDTDSIDASEMLKIMTPDGPERISVEEFYNRNASRPSGITLAGHESVATDDKILNWSEDKGLYYGNIKRIIRHKVSKPKWRLKTKSGKEIIVTDDHSMIVFRDGKKMEVKPRDIRKTDKILVVKD